MSVSDAEQSRAVDRAMSLTVFGATGGTGARVVESALAAGHEVTAVARRPEAVTARHARLTIVRGDVLDLGSTEAAIAGRDAIVSALGVGVSRGPTNVYSAGVGNIMKAMKSAGVRRLICVSASALAIDAEDPFVARIILKPLLQGLLKRPFADLAIMEREVVASGLDWTIVRPPRLTNGARTGRYRTALTPNLRGAFSISRADLADHVVRCIGDRASFGATVGIGY
jgi:putative NADH-flavin reductase